MSMCVHVCVRACMCAFTWVWARVPVLSRVEAVRAKDILPFLPNVY